VPIQVISRYGLHRFRPPARIKELPEKLSPTWGEAAFSALGYGRKTAASLRNYWNDESKSLLECRHRVVLMVGEALSQQVPNPVGLFASDTTGSHTTACR